MLCQRFIDELLCKRRGGCVGSVHLFGFDLAHAADSLFTRLLCEGGCCCEGKRHETECSEQFFHRYFLDLLSFVISKLLTTSRDSDDGECDCQGPTNNRIRELGKTELKMKRLSVFRSMPTVRRST